MRKCRLFDGMGIAKMRDVTALGRALRGAIAGAGATAIMSIVMMASERVGLMGRHPPERIAEHGLEASDEAPDERAVKAVGAVAHFAFGTAGGAAFGVIAGARDPGTAQRLAVPWAIAIWLVSYFGWIPAMHVLPPPSEDRPGRAWTMLVAHLVYGASLGTLWRWISPR